MPNAAVMLPSASVRKPRRWSVPALRFVVHLEAFLRDPVLYSQCVWWWATGKRLRSRLKLSPLLGHTKHAYQLWLEQSETHFSEQRDGTEIKLVAVVEDGQGIDDTLQSVDEAGFEAFVVSRAPEAALELPFEPSDNIWLLPLASGDHLHAHAASHYTHAATSADLSTHVIYADDDLIDDRSKRHTPHFKPDWNSELSRHFDFLTGAAMVRATSIDTSTLKGEGWASRLIQRGVVRTELAGGEVLHISEVLHHRKRRHAPVLPTSVQIEDRQLPSVSVIVPTRNRRDLLETCLHGLRSTRYPERIDIIVIDNGSDDPSTREYLDQLDPEFVRVVHDDGPFNFSALNNRAVAKARGKLLCFLNNDIEITDPDWLRIMASQAARQEIGAVGAQLRYPDGRIQHAGVVIGIGGAAAHAHRLLHPGDEGYFKRHSLPQFVSAVTAACMVVSREKFEAVSGFDEENFAVSFNDVDLCLKLREQGWHNLYEPRACLIHHESLSRGFDRDAEGAARQAEETAKLQERWGTGLAIQGEPRDGPAPDPFHHRALSLLSEQFVLAL